MTGMPKVPAALDCLSYQPRVREFLAAAVHEGRISQAYLFVGPPGSGKTEAARALAQCIICPNGGDGSCDECIRVRHNTHPDVRVLAPKSARGYLIAQIRELIDDVPLAPIRAASKVYVITDAGLLRGAAANALLKTLEEPPATVVFILIARTVAQVMPTIASRCQHVPFRVIAPEVAEHSIMQSAGVDLPTARIALAVAGTPEQAKGFLASADRRQARRIAIRTVTELMRDDDWDVIIAAKEIMEAVHAPIIELKKAQEAAAGEGADYLAASALHQLADANKRELTVRERSGMMEMLAAVASFLRDVLLRSEGVLQPVVNTDFADAVKRIACAVNTDGVVHALDAVREAQDDIVHNVTPRLAVEVMLFRIKEALTCPPLSR